MNKKPRQYYECHVTMTGDPQILRPLVEDLKWKFSCIDGDVVLGDGVKCYATMLYNQRMRPGLVLSLLHSVANQLTEMGATVLRKKMEQVLYDDRSSVVRCDGGCPECHTEDL